jgi:hypothetical protein
VEKAPLVGTSTPVSSLQNEEGPAAAPMANLVSISLINAVSVGVDLIVPSSDGEDEID